MKTQLKSRILIFALLCLLIIPVTQAVAQFRFRVKPYIGVGMKFVLQMNDPDYTMTDNLDSTYYDLHLASPRRHHFHFHARIMIMDFWNVSLGYMLWNHSFQYSDDLTEYWLQTGRVYPHSFYFTMHGAVAQITLDYPFISTASAKPYILGGIGKYNGATKNVHYLLTQYSNVLEQKTQADKEFEGWGWFIGFGATFWKYAFISVEYVDLYRRSLVASQFIQFSVGFTF